jgi:hypothetical protein
MKQIQAPSPEDSLTMADESPLAPGAPKVEDAAAF